MDKTRNQSFLVHGKMNIAGLVICTVLFLSGFIIHGNTGMYLNMSGFVIVVGGTLGATFLSYRFQRLMILFKVLKSSYMKNPISSDDIVETLVDLSVKRRLRGILSLQDDEGETTIVFLRQAIGFLVDGYTPDQIRDALHSEMYFFRMRRDGTGRVLTTMADVAPAFGLVGSVVGLIGMLGGVGDSARIITMIPIALTSTLYGIVLANFFFLPFAANIREQTFHELLLQKIITEGVVAIAGDLHPRMLERKLKSFLTPSARKSKIISLARIKAKFEQEDVETNLAPPEQSSAIQKSSAVQNINENSLKGTIV